MLTVWVVPLCTLVTLSGNHNAYVHCFPPLRDHCPSSSHIESSTLLHYVFWELFGYFQNVGKVNLCYFILFRNVVLGHFSCVQLYGL